MYLIFALEDEHVGDPAERNAQVNDLGLGHVVRDVADVHDPRRFGRTPRRVQLHLKNKNCSNFLKNFNYL